MDHSRREALKAGGSLGLFSVLLAMGMVKPGDAWAEARNKGLFETKSVAEAVSKLPRAQQIAYLIEKNPNTVTAVFELQRSVLP